MQPEESQKPLTTVRVRKVWSKPTIISVDLAANPELASRLASDEGILADGATPPLRAT